MHFFYYLIFFAVGIVIGRIAGYNHYKEKTKEEPNRENLAKNDEEKTDSCEEELSQEQGEKLEEDTEDKAGSSQPTQSSKKSPLKTKKARKERLMEEVREKGRITNDKVQELLGVSDTTATRYLNELRKEGVVERSGETRGIYYKAK